MEVSEKVNHEFNENLEYFIDLSMKRLLVCQRMIKEMWNRALESREKMFKDMTVKHDLGYLVPLK